MNKRRIQIFLSDEVWQSVLSITKDANEGFESGKITPADVLNEMIVTSKVDVKALQLKHTDLKKSLTLLAKRSDLDIESAIKALLELKAKTGKRRATSSAEEVA